MKTGDVVKCCWNLSNVVTLDHLYVVAGRGGQHVALIDYPNWYPVIWFEIVISS